MQFLRGKRCELYHAPFDVRLSRTTPNGDASIETVVQPDVCVICDPAKLDERGCLGAPDWIIEILSPGNVARDTKEKFDLYEEVGVREYWMVTPEQKNVVVYLLADDGTISFLEVNTRLQVEHPITEETSGVDLVLAQLQIAAGGPLPVLEDPEPHGHAFEFRINAEDPGRGFLPTPGSVATFVVPSGPGIRVDAGVRAGDTVPPQFDSLLAKLEGA